MRAIAGGRAGVSEEYTRQEHMKSAKKGVSVEGIVARDGTTVHTSSCSKTVIRSRRCQCQRRVISHTTF